MMRMSVLGVIAGLLIARTSSAEAPGFELGTRLGVGLPMGSVADDGADLDDVVSTQLPLWFDLGIRATDNVFVGGYFAYGFSSPGSDFDDACDLSGVDCSASILRVGAQLQYHFMPRKPTDAWGGLGIGWEKASLTAEQAGDDVTIDLSGLEWFMLQGGIDFRVADSVALGPFLALSFGKYGTASCETSLPVGCPEVSEEIDDKAFHRWLFFGVRGAFGPF